MFNHNKEKKPIWPKTVLTVAGVSILVTGSFFGGVIFAGSNSGVAYAGTNITRNRNEASQTSQSFDQRLFWQVWDTLKNNYVDQDNLTESQMFYGALKGIAESTGDPYTIFMTPEDTKEFEEYKSPETGFIIPQMVFSRPGHKSNPYVNNAFQIVEDVVGPFLSVNYMPVKDFCVNIRIPERTK